QDKHAQHEKPCNKETGDEGDGFGNAANEKSRQAGLEARRVRARPHALWNENTGANTAGVDEVIRTRDIKALQ
ncbi:MAG: hypothetical protein ACK5QX_03005, partial [bacterium]